MKFYTALIVVHRVNDGTDTTAIVRSKGERTLMAAVHDTITDIRMKLGWGLLRISVVKYQTYFDEENLVVKTREPHLYNNGTTGGSRLQIASSPLGDFNAAVANIPNFRHVLDSVKNNKPMINMVAV